MKVTNKETVREIADGKCPNKNCQLDGDIEEKQISYESDGIVKITFECHDCDTEFTITYLPQSVDIKEGKKFELLEANKE